MKNFQYAFGMLTIAFICIDSGNAISCYECNSATDKRCLGDENRKLPEDLKKTCPPREGKQFSLCRKIKQSIDFEVNGLKPDNRIIRTCGFDDSNYADRCYQRSGFGGRQEVCACQTDNCNKALNLTAPLALMISLLIFGIKLV